MSAAALAAPSVASGEKGGWSLKFTALGIYPRFLLDEKKKGFAVSLCAAVSFAAATGWLGKPGAELCSLCVVTPSG